MMLQLIRNIRQGQADMYMENQVLMQHILVKKMEK